MKARVTQTLVSALVLLSTLAMSCTLNGQSGTSASFSGVVVDESGGAVPGATVKLKLVSSGAERTMITGPEGRFLFLQANAGWAAHFQHGRGCVAALR